MRTGSILEEGAQISRDSMCPVDLDGNQGNHCLKVEGP